MQSPAFDPQTNNMSAVKRRRTDAVTFLFREPDPAWNSNLRIVMVSWKDTNTRDTTELWKVKSYFTVRSIMLIKPEWVIVLLLIHNQLMSVINWENALLRYYFHTRTESFLLVNMLTLWRFPWFTLAVCRKFEMIWYLFLHVFSLSLRSRLTCSIFCEQKRGTRNRLYSCLNVLCLTSSIPNRLLFVLVFYLRPFLKRTSFWLKYDALKITRCHFTPEEKKHLCASTFGSQWKSLGVSMHWKRSNIVKLDAVPVRFWPMVLLHIG